MKKIIWVFCGEGDGPGPVFDSLDKAYECGRNFVLDQNDNPPPHIELKAKRSFQFDDHRYKGLDQKAYDLMRESRLYVFRPMTHYSYYWLQRFEVEVPDGIDTVAVLESYSVAPEQVEGVWATTTEGVAYLQGKHNAQSIRLAKPGTAGCYWNVYATIDGDRKSVV